MGGQHASVELSDEDMIGKFTPEQWDSMSLLQKHHAMMNVGDTLLVDYMRAAGMISEEFFRGRITQIKARYP